MPPKKYFGLIAFSLILFLITVSFPAVTIHYSTPSYCLRCRLVQFDKSLLGFKYQQTEANAYTAWYQQKFPNHAHLWTVGCTSGKGLLGFGFCAYRKRHPLITVSPDLQILFVTTLSENEFRAFTQSVESADPECQNRAVSMISQKLDTLISSR